MPQPSSEIAWDLSGQENDPLHHFLSVNYTAPPSQTALTQIMPPVQQEHALYNSPADAAECSNEQATGMQIDPITPAPAQQPQQPQPAASTIPPDQTDATTHRPVSVAQNGGGFVPAAFDTQTTQAPVWPDHVPVLTVGNHDHIGSTPLTVNGSTQIWGNVHAIELHGEVHETSDQRIKCNIMPAKVTALDVINKLEVRQYNLKELPEGRQRLGVIAQQVRELHPNAVRVDPASGLLQVRTSELNFLHMKATQELDSKIDGVLGLLLIIMQHWLQLQLPTISAGDLDARQSQQPQITLESSSSDSPQALLSRSTAPNGHASVANSDSATEEQPLAASSSAFEPRCISDFKDNQHMVSYMLEKLGEDNDGVVEMCHRRIASLGQQAVWELFQQAQNKGVFIRQLNKKHAKAKIG